MSDRGRRAQQQLRTEFEQLRAEVASLRQLVRPERLRAVRVHLELLKRRGRRSITVTSPAGHQERPSIARVLERLDHVPDDALAAVHAAVLRAAKGDRHPDGYEDCPECEGLPEDDPRWEECCGAKQGDDESDDEEDDES